MKHLAPLLVSCTATFLLLAYSTIVTVAMPSISADLSVGFGALQWVIDVYTIALAVLLVPLGAVSDRLGRRTLLVGSLVAFGCASLLCALAPTSSVLVIGRCGQGVAAASLFATTLPLLEASYSGAAKHRAFAIWGAVSGLAAAVGNVSGGLLAAVGWRLVFALAVPIAAGATWMAIKYLPNDRPLERRRIDVPGMVSLSATIALLVIATLVFSDRGLTWTVSVLATLCAAALITFAHYQRRNPETAVIPRVLMHNRTFRTAVVIAAAYYFAAFGILPAISSWLHDALALSPAQIAMVLSVQPLVFFATSLLLGPRIGPTRRDRAFAAGLLLCAAGCLALALPTAVAGWAGILPAMALTGIGAGVISPALPAAAMQDVAPTQQGVSSSTVNASRQFGISLGVAACAISVRAFEPGSDPHRWGVTLLTIGAMTGGVCVAAALTTSARTRLRLN
ncbi:MFS transporter [Gordonia malaquae]|uniref:MFS transporter n=1 Tax=Gordonia malaquae TaxID=410332 RepID=UPI00301AB350